MGNSAEAGERLPGLAGKQGRWMHALGVFLQGDKRARLQGDDAVHHGWLNVSELCTLKWRIVRYAVSPP
jgi:hypothetical protein